MASSPRMERLERTDGLEEFAAWVEGLMRQRGYVIDGPRGGGKSRLADDAGVHRAAVTRLLQRQSMPDLETMRRLAGVLGVPLRDMLIRSGRLSEEDLPLEPVPGAGCAPAGRISPEEAARRMGVPEDLRGLFAKVARQFLPEGGSGGS
ncbi:helix-turn-helix domain-containing protein [Streptomyces diastatochromogenes]|uniref:helix-turn-helix domain-containing protein n=1 Tax=Streptomyces diastatochromogenes TaxID=42236 RepID=UPI0036932CB9